MSGPEPGPVNAEGFVTSAQAAKLAGIPAGTWRSLRFRGQAPDPAMKLDGRTWLWDAEDVRAWAEGYRKGRAAYERDRAARVERGE